MHEKAKFTEVTGIREQEWTLFLCWLSSLDYSKNYSQRTAQEIEFFSTIRKRVEAQEFETDSLACATIAFHLGALMGSLADIISSEEIIYNTEIILSQLKRN